MFLCIMYLVVDSCFRVCVSHLGVTSWKMVYIGRWSDRGGDSVPAVAATFVRFVSVTSIRVDVWWCGSYRVGVVIVVCRLFSIMKLISVIGGSSRLMFISPCIAIEVFGCAASILSIASWRCRMKSGWWWGRRYMLMIVWIGLFMRLSLCICIIMVFASGMLMSSMYVICMSCFVYTDTSFACFVL